MHVLAADGVFRADGTFVPLPPIPEALLEGGFRRAVLDFLVAERAISEELRSRMLGWRYSGFSVHDQVCVAAEDVEGRKKLAAYMRHAAFAQAEIRSKLESYGLEIVSSTPEEFEASFRAETPLWVKAIHDAGVKLD